MYTGEIIIHNERLQSVAITPEFFNVAVLMEKIQHCDKAIDAAIIINTYAKQSGTCVLLQDNKQYTKLMKQNETGNIRYIFLPKSK